MTDLDGNVIKDASGHIGFPGFDGMEATVSLSWTAQMQEAGIPDHVLRTSPTRMTVTVTLRQTSTSRTGPGEAGYVQQLKDYDNAFAKFFERLAADGINKSNTLFVFTVDEGDKFVGDQPTAGGMRRRQRRVQLQPRRSRSTAT